MRSFLIFANILMASTVAFADSQNYNSDYNFNDRKIPSQQYGNGTTEQSGGKAVTTSSYHYLSNPNYDLNASLEGGYRTSELKWSIAGNGVNILSELQWKKVHGYEIQPSVEYIQKSGKLHGLNLQASVNKSFTSSGDNQDSDYDGNNRTQEFSRSNNKSDSGGSDSFSASIGYSFDFKGSRQENLTRFTALFGYALQRQRFSMGQGYQTIATGGLTPPLGPIGDLDSSYDAEFSAPYIGLELNSRFMEKHNIKLTGRFLRGYYTGTGHWNQRPDFAHPDSFVQEANGYGLAAGIKYGWEFYPRTQLTLGYNYNYFKTGSGTDTNYMADGSVLIGYFNKAEYSSMDFMTGLNYKF